MKLYYGIFGPNLFIQQFLKWYRFKTQKMNIACSKHIWFIKEGGGGVLMIDEKDTVVSYSLEKLINLKVKEYSSYVSKVKLIA